MTTWTLFPDMETEKIALINTRSLSNKTCIISNDFIVSHKLDFLFMTETWLNTGDLDSLSVTSPSDCNFFSSPRTVGRSGGLAKIFKKHFSCRLLPVETFSSFKVQLCQADLVHPILCALIHRPPKYDKFLLKDFFRFV